MQSLARRARHATGMPPRGSVRRGPVRRRAPRQLKAPRSQHLAPCLQEQRPPAASAGGAAGPRRPGSGPGRRWFAEGGDWEAGCLTSLPCGGNGRLPGRAGRGDGAARAEGRGPAREGGPGAAPLADRSAKFVRTNRQGRRRRAGRSAGHALRARSAGLRSSSTLAPPPRGSSLALTAASRLDGGHAARSCPSRWCSGHTARTDPSVRAGSVRWSWRDPRCGRSG